MSHATGDTKGGGDSRQNGNNSLNNKFPGFSFHIRDCLKIILNCGIAASILNSQLKDGPEGPLFTHPRRRCRRRCRQCYHQC